MKAVLDRVIVGLQKEQAHFFLGSFEKQPDTGIVVSVGAYANGGCKVGDTVVFDKRGNDFAFEKDGEEYLVIQERRVYFILNEGNVSTTYDKVVVSNVGESELPTGTVVAVGCDVSTVKVGGTATINPADVFSKEIEGALYCAVPEKKVIFTGDEHTAAP